MNTNANYYIGLITPLARVYAARTKHQAARTAAKAAREQMVGDMVPLPDGYVWDGCWEYVRTPDCARNGFGLANDSSLRCDERCWLDNLPPAEMLATVEHVERVVAAQCVVLAAYVAECRNVSAQRLCEAASQLAALTSPATTAAKLRAAAAALENKSLSAR